MYVTECTHTSDDKARIGYLSCKICGQKFSADTDTLTQPIDVYSYVLGAHTDNGLMHARMWLVKTISYLLYQRVKVCPIWHVRILLPFIYAFGFWYE